MIFITTRNDRRHSVTHASELVLHPLNVIHFYAA